jgi:hypothetical protein
MSFILYFLYRAGGVEAAEAQENFAIKQGSALSGDYPQLSVKDPAVNSEEGRSLAEWEIHFALGDDPEQWDHILIGELLTDNIKRSPIRWGLTDESGNVWPPNTSSSALEMNWLSPDTLGWNISASAEMPFETLKNKRFTIKLTAIMTLNPDENGKEGILNGTFINCYYKHALKHYNSTYTGAQAQNASTAFKRVSLYENGMEPLAGDALVAAEDSMLDSYDFPALEYKEPEQFRYYTPPSTQLDTSDNYDDYRDLYVEGEEFSPSADGESGGVSDYELEIAAVPDYASGLNDSGYDSAFEFDSNAEYPAVSENPGSRYAAEPQNAAEPYRPEFPSEPALQYIDEPWRASEPAYGQFTPMPAYDAEPAPPGVPAEIEDSAAYGSAFSYPQNDDYFTNETIEGYTPEAAPRQITRGSAPDTIIPEAMIPEAVIPEAAIPEAAIPEAAIPDTIIPEALLPEATIPEAITPETIIPEAMIPEAVIPEEAITPAETITPNAPEAAVNYGSTLELYNYRPDLSESPAAEPKTQPGIDAAPTASPKTRSTTPQVVSDNDEPDSKSNPTTRENNLFKEICAYFLLCVSISLFFALKKQRRS